MTIAIPQVNTATDTFGQWIQKFNLTLNALSTQIITTDSNTTVGNSAITGAWQANVVYTNTLSGGTNGNTGNLAVTSNVVFSANTSHVRIDVSNLAIINTAVIETANIDNFSVNTTTANTANVNYLFANTANVVNFQISGGNSVHVAVGNTSTPARTTYRKSFGTVAAPTQVNTTTTIGEIIWEAYGNTVFVPAAAIRIKRSGAVTDVASGANLVLCTPSNLANNLIERISVNTDGSLTPINDNSQELGSSGFRFSNVYATFARIGNSTINTTITNNTINVATINTSTGNVVALTSNTAGINVATVNTATINTVNSNNVTANNITANQSLNISGNTVTSTVLVTTSNTSTQVVDSFPLATYRGGRYTTQISLANNQSFQISELLVLHNGEACFVTEFGIVFTLSTLGSFTASANATHAIISFSPTFANNTLKLSKTLFTV